MIERELKFGEMLAIRNELLKIKGLRSIPVRYAIKRNIEVLTDTLKPMGEIEEENSKLIAEFNAERLPILEKYSEKDDKGNFKFKEVEGQPKEYVLIESKKSEFEKEIEKLRKKHKPSLNKYEEASKEYIKQLTEKSETVKFYPLKMEDINEDLSDDVFNILYLFMEKKD